MIPSIQLTGKFRTYVRLLLAIQVTLAGSLTAGEAWTQFKFDSRHSGNAEDREVAASLGLIGAVPLSDGVFTSPVVADGNVYVVDGSGTAYGLDADTLELKWKFASGATKSNCNNLSSPAYIDGFLHFGTIDGSYFVLNASTGKQVHAIRSEEPIFSSPVVANGRVYFSTLGSRIHALEADGTVLWEWDYVKERLGFSGDRWNGAEWARHKENQRLEPKEQFHCSRELAVFENKIIIPTGGTVTWLEDLGDKASFYATVGDGYATLGVSVGPSGEVYRQWHRLDNGGTVQIYPLDRIRDNKAEKTGDVPGTLTSWNSIESLGFSSVSVRGNAIYRCRPEDGFGLCRHPLDGDKAESVGGPASIASPVLAGDTAIYGGLDGKLHFVPLSGKATNWSFETAFGKAISAPVAVADGKVYFGCDDGYLYVLGPDGNASLPTEDLDLWRIRSPLTSQKIDERFDRFTSYANWNNSNSNQQEVEPPFELKWIRRFKGTIKHFSTFGGGRMYTHTAEGKIFAVEQETGRLLWRRFFPGVHNSYTSALYHKGQLFVPQAGFDDCQLRCLDAETGALIWEAPFSGSPSWNRQLPPVVWNDLVIYMFGTGKYAHRAPEGQSIPWLFEHQNNARFPQSHEPILTAFDRKTGKEVWSVNFSNFGAGGDEAGICMMDGVLYYSAFFGHSPSVRRGLPGAKGLTAAIDPETGKFIWMTTKHWMNGGCTISGAEGKLYLGGYNPVNGTSNRYVWCLDAKDGSLIWQSDPLKEAIQVVTAGPRFLFVHAQYQNSYLLNKQTGNIETIFPYSYKCTRFSLSDPYLAGSNMDIIDLSDIHDVKLISTGPRIDPSDCVGAVFSNGRMFYTGHGAGLQTSQIYGKEARISNAAPIR